MRLLLSDWIFPSQYAKWRLSEIRSFIQKYDTDIFCPEHINDVFGFNLSLDWNNVYNSHNLKDYDIYIFSKKYVFLQKYNSPEFDGTSYIGKYPGKYLIRLKKYRNIEISIEKDYDAYYHIFLCTFKLFSNLYSIDPTKHFIHVYPGGGCEYPQNIKEFTSTYGTNFGIICSQNRMLDVFKENGCTNLYLSKLAPFCCQDDILKERPYNPFRNFNVVFTSKGDPVKKGLYNYENIAIKYKEKYPNDKVNFNTFGNCYMYISQTHVTNWGFKSQYELDELYNRSFDIYINLYDGDKSRYEGFPLGCEAAMQGVVLFTTDCNNVNEDYYLSENDGIFIIDVNQLDLIVEKIHKLYENKELCYNLGIKAQRKMWELCCYENNQSKIFDFIENGINESG